MQKSVGRSHLQAGVLICSTLLAFAPAPASTFAQATNSPRRPDPSLISIAPDARPQGEALVRSAKDATFQHAPANYHIFRATTAGEDAGVEQIILNFGGDTRLTRIESKSKDFVVESGGTCHEGNNFAKGESCSLQIRFNPQGPGHRLGHLEITDSAEAEPLYVGLVGNGYAPVVNFVPSQITTVPGTFASGAGVIKGSTNITVDGGDIVYIADTGNTLIRKIDSSGTVSNTTPVAAPQSIAVDSFGLIYSISPSSTDYLSYYYPTGSYTWYFDSYSAGTCTSSAPCNVATVGMGNPNSLSIDSNNNLFLEEETKGAMEAPVGGVAGYQGLGPAIDVWYLQDEFAPFSGAGTGMAVNASDELFTAYSYSTTACYIVEESAYAAEGTSAPSYTRVAGGDQCGYSGDGGQGAGAEIGTSVGQIAFDAAGDLYFTDTGNQRVRRIDSDTGIIHTIAGTGTAGYTGDSGPATAATLSTPTGVAVDSEGQVYVISTAGKSGSTQVVRRIGTSGYVGFGSQVNGTSSAAQTVLVTNTGNSDMTLTQMVLNGTDPGDFAVDRNTTTCNLTVGAALYSGQSCRIGVIFSPKAAGTRQANLVLLDNTVIGADTIILNGTGTLSTPTLRITSPASGASFASGSSVTFTVSVIGVSGVPAPTGTVQFKVDGANHGAAVAVSSGVATTTLTGLKSGSHTLAATYSGDANYTSASSASESITIKAPAAAKVTLARAANAPQACGSETFAVDVTGASPLLPTGTVELQDGTKVLATGTLEQGKVTLRAHITIKGTYSLTAHYSGDVHHLAATSAELKVTEPSNVRCEAVARD
jgi:hypothetical protein